jgi:hypothetical protein
MPLPRNITSRFASREKISNVAGPSEIIGSITKVVKDNGSKLRALVKLFSIKTKTEVQSTAKPSFFKHPQIKKPKKSTIAAAIAGIAGLGLYALLNSFGGGKGASDTPGAEGKGGEEGVDQEGSEENDSWRSFEVVSDKFKELLVKIEDTKDDIVKSIASLGGIILPDPVEIPIEQPQVNLVAPKGDRLVPDLTEEKETAKKTLREKLIQRKATDARWKEIQEDIKEKNISRTVQREQQPLKQEKQMLKEKTKSPVGKYGIGRINDPGQSEHGRAVILMKKEGPMWTFRYPDQTDADFKAGIVGNLIGERFITVIEQPGQTKLKTKSSINNINNNAVANPEDFLFIYNNNRVERTVEQE